MAINGSWCRDYVINIDSPFRTSQQSLLDKLYFKHQAFYISLIGGEETAAMALMLEQICIQ